ncbi:MAG: hypothetical protein L0Z55_04695 [Planctomycetes bacterium]|nr:hypothetical protein [Planctomycetota bacterium]
MAPPAANVATATLLDPAAETAAATRRFVEIEEELELFSLEVEGCPLWDLARFGIGERVLAALGLFEKERGGGARARGRRIRASAGALCSAAFRNPFLAAPCEFLFLGHPRRVLRGDGRWWDPYSDPLADSLGERALVLERPNAEGHCRPPHSRRLRHLDVVPLLAAARGALWRHRLAPPLRNRFAEIEMRLIGAFGQPVAAAAHLEERLALYRAQYPIYRALFRRLRPAALFVVVSYGNEVPIAAAKSLGIPTIELQHGIISPYHLAYSFPPGAMKRTFPDHVFLFGDYWKECVRFPIAADRLHATGFPYFDEERAAVAGATRKEQVVFLSQWSIGRALSRLACEAARHPRLKGKIVYRLHPSERATWREDYPWLAHVPLEVVDPATVPLYRQLAESRVQVGAYSTAVVEGIALGLQTFIANLPGSAALDPLVASTPNVSWYLAPEQLALALDASPAPNSLAAPRLFRPVALANMHLALANVIDCT